MKVLSAVGSGEKIGPPAEKLTTTMRAHLILYVADQAKSAAFYRKVLGAEPTLDVAGMTEFALSGDAVLGLMPEKGISRLLGVDCSSSEHQPPRAEFYLVIANARAVHQRALDAGAVELSAFALRDWGPPVAYSRDPDGHILAIASPEIEIATFSTS